MRRRAEKKYEKEKFTVLRVGHQDRISKLNKYAAEDHGKQEYLLGPDNVFSRKFGMAYGGGIVFINRRDFPLFPMKCSCNMRASLIL